ncbi:MAG: TetR/AcrR family transcriptional regulator [Promethearchaeota archaeon]
MKKSEDDKKNRIQQRKEKERELRRNQIINAAESLFLSKGFNDTKIEQIAYEASLSKGTVYNYFDSKDQLYLAIASIAYSKLFEYTKRSIKGFKPGINKLNAFGKAFYTFSKEYPNYAKVVHNYDSKTNLTKAIIEKKDPILNSREFEDLNKVVNQYRMLFIQIITEGIESNSIRKDLDPNLLALTLSMLTGGIIEELTKNRFFLKNLKILEEDIIALVFDWIGEGLRPKSQK